MQAEIILAGYQHKIDDREEVNGGWGWGLEGFVWKNEDYRRFDRGLLDRLPIEIRGDDFFDGGGRGARGRKGAQEVVDCFRYWAENKKMKKLFVKQKKKTLDDDLGNLGGVKEEDASSFKGEGVWNLWTRFVRNLVNR